MKKIFLLILACLFLTGCGISKVSVEKEEYNYLVEKLQSVEEKKFSNNYPFTIKVNLEKIIESEVTYRVLIDSPAEKITDLKILAINNVDTTNVYPSSGIFDKKLNLDPDYINKEEGYVKGVMLVGYIPFDETIDKFKGEIRVLVQYKMNEKDYEVYYRYQKKTK